MATREAARWARIGEDYGDAFNTWNQCFAGSTSETQELILLVAKHTSDIGNCIAGATFVFYEARAEFIDMLRKAQAAEVKMWNDRFTGSDQATQRMIRTAAKSLPCGSNRRVHLAGLTKMFWDDRERFNQMFRETVVGPVPVEPVPMEPANEPVPMEPDNEPVPMEPDNAPDAKPEAEKPACELPGCERPMTGKLPCCGKVICGQCSLNMFKVCNFKGVDFIFTCPFCKDNSKLSNDDANSVMFRHCPTHSKVMVNFCTGEQMVVAQKACSNGCYDCSGTSLKAFHL